MYMKRSLCLTVVALLAIAGAAHGAEVYKVDPGHSHVGFSVRHFGVSNVRGEFKKFESDLMVDETDVTESSIGFTIETASIDTDHEQRDGHLKSADFLDVENHPRITFKSKSISKAGDGEYVAIGDLTIRGVTKEVELSFELAGPLKDPLGMMRLGAEGGVTIDRQDFGVSWSRVMDNGGLFVGDDVKIGFSIEAARPIAEPTGEEASKEAE